MCFDEKRKALWLATEGGIHYFDLFTEKYQTVQIESSQIEVGDHITQLFVDEDLLFIGTPKGIL